MTKLRLGPGLELPIEATTTTFGVLGKRGSGKTTWAVDLLEELLDAGQRAVVVDPLGVWTGIRSSFDGKSVGYPIIILGGDHGDIPLEPTSGKVIAEWIVTERQSAVIDIGLFRKAEQRRFVEDFAHELYRRNREAMHLILDEADLFAPQRPMPGEQGMLGAIEDLVRRGRARGIGMTFITQRPAVLHKDILTQAENLVAFRMIGPQDRDAIEAWIKYHGTDAERKEVLSSLSSLPVGCGWFWSPGWLQILKKVQFRQRRTFDSSKTPLVGGSKNKPSVKLAPVDLAKLQGKIAETVERLKKDDPRLLKARVAELEKQLKQPAKVETKTVTRVPVELLEHVRQLKQSFADQVDAIIKEITAKGTREENASELRAPTEVQGRAVRRESQRPPSNSSLPKGELAALTVIAQANGRATREMITVLTGYKRSTRDAYLQRLKEKGYIEGLNATKAGIAALGLSYEPLPTGPALQQYWLERLPSGEATILGILLHAYPKGISRASIGDRTEFQRSTRDAYIQRLKAKLLVTVNGEIRAAEELFA